VQDGCDLQSDAKHVEAKIHGEEESGKNSAELSRVQDESVVNPLMN